MKRPRRFHRDPDPKLPSIATAQHEYEKAIISKARDQKARIIKLIYRLHHEWKADCEIAGALGITALEVWHTRQIFNINRR